MAAAASAFERIPEELLWAIFAHLDAPPPSQVKARHEPHLGLTHAPPDQQHLKTASLVSRTWRRIVLPLLFRCARLPLDALPRPRWEDCRGCLRYASEHWATSRDATTPLSEIAAYHDGDLPAVGTVTTDQWSANERLGTWSGLTWESRFYHRSAAFLAFVEAHGLAVDSLVVSTDRLLKQPGRYPHRAPAAADRFKAAAVLWQRLLAALDPRRVVVLAPPAELSYLANAAVDLFGEWAFADMDLHVLELSRECDAPPSPSLPRRKFSLSSLRYTPDDETRIADASLLHLRPWTHLALNEGSFLRAYGTYEYFERGPPSIIYSIKNCFTSGSTHTLHALRHFTYTAILPFAQHLDFRAFLPQLEELDVQLAPHPTSNILHDKDRIGKAELQDCWQEFYTGYRLLLRPFTTHALSAEGGSVAATVTGPMSAAGANAGLRLQRFVCRDLPNATASGSKLLKRELDEECIPLCLPVWAEMEEGVFVRLPERSTVDTTEGG